MLQSSRQAWCIQLALQGEAELTGPHQIRWLGWLAAELDNLRAALQSASGSLNEDIVWLQLAYRLYWFWYLHSAVGEGQAVFERALVQTADGERSWARGIALLGSGAMALYQGELSLARARLQASLPILRTLDDLFSKAVCERIKAIPIPRQYDYFTRMFVQIFVVLLPFFLIKTLTTDGVVWLVIPLTGVIAFLFSAIERTGAVNEDPFENRITDVPLSATCRDIERDLRALLGETDLPAKLEPQDGYLF